MKMYCFRYYHWIISIIMTSSYRQTSYPRPPFISLINQPILPHSHIYFCSNHASFNSLTKQIGAFFKTQSPLTNGRAGFGSFTYNANLPHIAPHKYHRKVTFYTCNVISCDWFVAYKYYVTKVEPYRGFDTLLADSAAIWAVESSKRVSNAEKGSQITN